MDLKQKRGLLCFALITVIIIHSVSVIGSSKTHADFELIDKMIDGMDTWNDLEKDYYKDRLKRILTDEMFEFLDKRVNDIREVAHGGDAEKLESVNFAGDVSGEIMDYAERMGMLNAYNSARPIWQYGKGAADKINTILYAYIYEQKRKAYMEDPESNLKRFERDEAVNRLYGNLVGYRYPLVGIVLGKVSDTFEGARKDAVAEIDIKLLMDSIIREHETQLRIEHIKEYQTSQTASFWVQTVFFMHSDPNWGNLRYVNSAMLYKMAEYIEHDRSNPLFINIPAGVDIYHYLKIMRGGGPAGFAKFSPVYMTITDPLGHEYGIDPDTKQLLCDQNALCRSITNAKDMQYVIVPSIHNGTYHIRLVGFDDGNYSFLFNGFNNNYELQGVRKFSGYVHKGEVLEADLAVTLHDGYYNISETDFTKSRDSYPIPERPEIVLPGIDRDDLEIYLISPCVKNNEKAELLFGPEEKTDEQPKRLNLSELLDEAGITDIYTQGGSFNFTATQFSKTFTMQSKTSDLCIASPRQRFTFLANKDLDPSTVSKDTVIVTDEEDKPLEGYLDADFRISFIPSRPIFGDIRIVLKGGKSGICSKSKICLEKDLSFKLGGTKKTSDYIKDIPYTLNSPFLSKTNKIILINNTGGTKATDITFSTHSFMTYFPNTFVRLERVSPEVEYEIKDRGENSIIEFKIDEIKPHESLIINVSYATLYFGRDYYSRLDVEGMSDYHFADVLKEYTESAPEIESDDPIIINQAKQIVGDEKNIYWKAFKIYDWITKNIDYNYDLVSSGSALATLQKKKGICHDYAELFIALARAEGIPSRYITLWVETDSLERHASAEFYLPEYGWIPVDPTWGMAIFNFAGQNPGYLLTIFKEDKVTDRGEYDYDGKNTEDLKFNVSVEMSPLEIEDDAGWSYYFQSPFFEDIYALTVIFDLKEYFDIFKRYNEELDETLFSIPDLPQEESIILTRDAIEAYRQGAYETIEKKVNRWTDEYFAVAADSFLSLSEQAREHLNKKNYTSYQLSVAVSLNETRMLDYNESLALLDKTISDMQEVNDLAGRGDKATAVYKFKKVYGESSLQLWSIANEIYFDHSFEREFNFSPHLADEDLQKLLDNVQTPPLPKSLVVSVMVFFLLCFLMGVFWLWMLVHSMVIPKTRHLSKIAWFLIIFFLSILGAAAYFFIEFVYRKKRR